MPQKDFIERRIIIGLITNTEYCQRIQEYWNVEWIESAMAKRLSEWCWEYFKKYDKAPERNIEAIYHKKLRQGKSPKDLFSEIEENILSGLSDEYEKEGLNVDQLYEDTLEYFNERHLTIFNAKVEALRSEGKTDEAERLMMSFQPLGLSGIKIGDYIKTVWKIRKTKHKRPRSLLSPLIREGELVIIYGHAGTGKSLFAMLIAYLLGLKEWDNKAAEINEWKVSRPTGTLYVDGELGEVEMEERLRKYEWIGKQDISHEMRIFSLPEYQLATTDPFLLSNHNNQYKIIKWLKEHPNYKLVVLDSVTTLFGLEDENNNSEIANKINPFLRELRALGVACILLHHAGKDGKKGLRGGSALSALANYILRLIPHPSYSMDDGEAWFIVTKDKQRAGGNQFGTFALHIYQTGIDTENPETHWKVTSTDPDE